MANETGAVNLDRAEISMPLLLAIALAVLLASGSTAIADFAAKSCTEAIRNHHTVQARAKVALANYDACISGHFGRDDCKKSFTTLAAAQKAYAIAVSEKAVQCGQ